MIFCIATKTPLPEAWKIGIGVVQKYLARVPDIMPLIAPFTEKAEEEKPTVTPRNEVRRLAAHFRLPGSEPWQR